MHKHYLYGIIRGNAAARATWEEAVDRRAAEAEAQNEADRAMRAAEREVRGRGAWACGLGVCTARVGEGRRE